MAETVVSLLNLIEAYGVANKRAVPTILSIIKTIALPAWRVRHGPKSPLAEAIGELPAHRLYGLLEGSKARWRADVGKNVPPGKSYQQAYPRALRRLVAFGEEQGMLHPDQFAISPEWRLLLKEVDLVPRRLAVGATARWAFRRMARWATAANVPPAGVPALGKDGRIMGDFRGTFPLDGDGGFYQARRVWNALVVSQPGLGLSHWPAEARDSLAALPRDSWPTVVADGFATLLHRDGLGAWKAETRQGYALRVASYLGVLGLLGVAPANFLSGVTDGSAAMRLLFQGLPDRLRGLDEQALVSRLAGESGFTDALLAEMASFDGQHDGKSCAPNPFVVAAVRAYAAQGKFTSALDLLSKAAAMNRGFLGVTERHVSWVAPQVRMLEQLARRNPSAYATKKRRVFRHPDLWRRLVSARPRLRAHTAALEASWVAAAGSEVRWRKLRWAVALRDEVLIGLLLCYPLRVGNLVAMEIGRHYDPDTYDISFPAEETKNEREIDYVLPDAGALGDLRGLIDRYLAEARPALLEGRRSARLFVPGPRGGTSFRSRAINGILATMSREFFADVLPAGVEVLNPHLLRHAAATYHLALGGGLNLAAQMLNDSPATISKSYADILDSKKEATKRFLSAFEV